MKKTPFILHEKFRSDNNEQRKERFQKEFERYIIDGLLNAVPPRSCALCCAWMLVYKKRGANHESSHLLPPEQRR